MNKLNKMYRFILWVFVLQIISGFAAVAKTEAGVIKIDGSSTVFPISEAVSEEFGKTNRDIHVTIGVSGTGGGFKKFCNGETDINDASRPIKSSEIEHCKKTRNRLH